MAYTTFNYPSKRMLKDAVRDGVKVTVYQPGMFPLPSNYSGTVYLEGPHYPRPHTWYAEVTVVNGIITKVK